MIANLEPTAAKAGTPIYHLKIVLDGTKPPVWRRLQVPGNAHLGWLHAVIQVAMGWTNSHLHQFLIGDLVCADPASQPEEFDADPPVLDENKITLAEAASRQNDVLGYEYDFGDSWHHEVTVEKILSSDPASATGACCLDGARACPPEDCGGTWGYDDLLKILQNPKHEEHDSMKEWLGRPFDAEQFDRDKVNKHLKRLKWPRVTEGQLRLVLIARDDYRK